MITQPITMDRIREVAPSVFAMEPHESRSRIEGKSDFTKHMLRFRHVDAQSVTSGDSLPELVLINSHDGTSAYKLMGGIFRMVCSNGMVIPESLCGSVSVQHKGNIVDDVIEASFSVMEDTQGALAVTSEWQRLLLTAPEQQIFAEAAHGLRFADNDGTIDTPIMPAQLLSPRRRDDKGNDLWRTFNRVQENVIRGGLRARHDREHDFRRVTTRPVKGIDQDVKLNRALFTLAEKMAELKAA